MPIHIESGAGNCLAPQIKCALLREVFNRRLITQQQFEQLAQQQRGR